MRWTLLLIALSTHPLLAATDLAYTVRIAHVGPLGKTQTFTVVRSGDRARASLIDGPEGEGVLYDGLLQIDRTHLVALNSRNRTWYELESVRPFALDSQYLDPAQKPRIKNIRVVLDPPSQSLTDPHQQHHTGQISYDVNQSFQGNTLKISCAARFQITTSNAFDRSAW